MVKEQLPTISWTNFCHIQLERFGHDEHELLIRRLFHCRMTGTVSEYIEQFTALVDQLKAYAAHPDPIYYVQRFIDGLRDDIKAVVLVQRPSSLDTACVLAQLQEEVTAPRKPFHWLDAPPQFKSSTVGAHPLPLPPIKPAAAAETRPPDPMKPTTAEDKYQALREHRRSRSVHTLWC